MRILHIQGIFSPEHGGPAHSLANYCVGQARRGHEVSAWVLEGFRHTSSAIRLPPPVKTVVHRVGFPAALGRSAEMRRHLATLETPDVIHLHGAWLRAMHYGAAEARRRGVPCLVEVMGMYEPWGLRQKWPRKRIARWWFQDSILRDAACLHVNSAREGEHLRQLGFTAPLAVIPVGVDTDSVAERQRALPETSPWPELHGRLFFLYLSRLHEKKGIELLLNSWAALAPQFAGSTLLVAGTGEPDYVAHCKRLAADLGIADRCLWAGRVTEEQKAWALSNAAFFTLPSYSENFGNIVAEALAHGTPVITTDATPWEAVRERGCGWIASPSAGGLSGALEHALQSDRATLKAMGARGREWSCKVFSLSHVLDSLDQTCLWLTGRGAKPDCVTG